MIRAELRSALIYRFNGKPLGVSLTLCEFSRILIIGSTPGPFAYLAIGSWGINSCQVWISSYRAILKSNQKVVYFCGTSGHF